MLGKSPVQYHEAAHLGPSAVGDEQCVGADVEWRGRAKISAPHSNGVHVPEIFIQHVRHHAQDVREVAISYFIFEIADDDRSKIPLHNVDCLAPIKRNSPGWSSWSIMRPAKVLPIRSPSD